MPDIPTVKEVKISSPVEEQDHTDKQETKDSFLPRMQNSEPSTELGFNRKKKVKFQNKKPLQNKKLVELKREIKNETIKVDSYYKEKENKSSTPRSQDGRFSPPTSR